MTPEVRRLRADEGPLLRRVRLAALADSPDAFVATLAQDEALDDAEWTERAGAGAVFVALDGAEPLGMAGVHWREDEPGTISVWGMWVAPGARRLGLGTALVGAGERWAREQGATRLRLGVMADVPAAIAFYERLGFARLGEPQVFRRDTSRRWLLMAHAL